MGHDRAAAWLTACLVACLLLVAWFYRGARNPCACFLGDLALGAVAGAAAGLAGAAAMSALGPRRPASVAGGGAPPPAGDTFTYYMPPDAGSVLTALTMGPAEGAPGDVVITAYYAKGKLYLTDKKTAKALGYAPSDVLHSEHHAHNEKLHSPEAPYEWHGHLKLAKDRAPRVLKNLLDRYGPQPAETHYGRIVGREKGESRAFPDGARIDPAVCSDKSGLEFLVGVRRRWGARPALTGVEVKWIEEAVGHIRPDTAARVVSLLLGRFHPDDVATWVGVRGRLQHYLARVGAAEALEMLAARAPAFDVDAVRPTDRSTIAHIGAWNAARGATPKIRDGGARVLEFAKANGADLSLKNKSGEKCGDFGA